MAAKHNIINIYCNPNHLKTNFQKVLFWNVSGFPWVIFQIPTVKPEVKLLFHLPIQLKAKQKIKAAKGTYTRVKKFKKCAVPGFENPEIGSSIVVDFQLTERLKDTGDACRSGFGNGAVHVLVLN